MTGRSDFHDRFGRAESLRHLSGGKLDRLPTDSSDPYATARLAREIAATQVLSGTNTVRSNQTSLVRETLRQHHVLGGRDAIDWSAAGDFEG